MHAAQGRYYCAACGIDMNGDGAHELCGRLVCIHMEDEAAAMRAALVVGSSEPLVAAAVDASARAVTWADRERSFRVIAALSGFPHARSAADGDDGGSDDGGVSCRSTPSASSATGDTDDTDDDAVATVDDATEDDATVDDAATLDDVRDAIDVMVDYGDRHNDDVTARLTAIVALVAATPAWIAEIARALADEGFAAQFIKVGPSVAAASAALRAAAAPLYAAAAPVARPTAMTAAPHYGAPPPPAAAGCPSEASDTDVGAAHSGCCGRRRGRADSDVERAVKSEPGAGAAIVDSDDSDDAKATGGADASVPRAKRACTEASA